MSTERFLRECSWQLYVEEPETRNNPNYGGTTTQQQKQKQNPHKTTNTYKDMGESQKYVA